MLGSDVFNYLPADDSSWNPTARHNLEWDASKRQWVVSPLSQADYAKKYASNIQAGRFKTLGTTPDQSGAMNTDDFFKNYAPLAALQQSGRF